MATKEKKKTTPEANSIVYEEGAKPKYNSLRADRAKGKFLREWANHGFNISKTMAALGYAKTNFNKWIKTDAKFAQRIQDFKDKVVDDSLEGMIKLGEKGDFRALQFLLQTLGKERGFVVNNSTTLTIKELPKIELKIPTADEIEKYHSNEPGNKNMDN